MPDNDHPTGATDAREPPLSGLPTERINAATAAIDQMTPLQIVQAMNAEDAVVASAVARELPQIARAIAAIAPRLRRGGRLIYAGAGTSGRLGALDAAEIPPTFNVAEDMVIGCIAGGAFALSQAAEDLEDSAAAGEADMARLGIGADDTLVGITASGRTPYVLGALAQARARGALRIGLVCNAPTPLHAAVDMLIAPLVGPEVVAGSTRLKAGTAQKMVLNMLSTGTMILLGKTYGNLMVDVRATNHKLRERALTILGAATGLARPACEAWLTATNGEVKTAILAARANLTPDAARARLDAHGQVLRAALDAPADTLAGTPAEEAP
ncbi:MAG TPA: N-acetylmuramic acid 6-phosphate etherase [Ktedonobacterales bacterium]|jgi:N-acetylmuramic acid 6-phosphate etherase